MRAVLQRVTTASVAIDGDEIASVERGLLVLLGIGATDGPDEVVEMARKIAGIRLFPGPAGSIDRSVLDIEGSILLVSQFTLLADTRRGRRPSFVAAARPEVAAPLCDDVATALRAAGCRVETGRFGADMQVSLVNDGPVTVVLDIPG